MWLGECLGGASDDSESGVYEIGLAAYGEAN
jgi:hypothetical protein